MSLHVALGNWSEISCGRDMGGKTEKGQPDFLLDFRFNLGKTELGVRMGKNSKKWRGWGNYPQSPELVADADESVVLHSAGAVSKLLQIACLYASGVLAPEYSTPLMMRVGEALAS